MSKFLDLSMILMGALCTDSLYGKGTTQSVPSIKTLMKEEEENQKKLSQIIQPLKKGLIPFYYRTTEKLEIIYSINQRVADKKAKKLGYV